MRIFYSPETDSLNIKLRDGGDEVEGEIMGEDLSGSVIIHRDEAGKLYQIEILGNAGDMVDLSRLEVEGLPVSVSGGGRRESKVG